MSADNPVVAEVTESDRFTARFHTMHELAQNRVISVAPNVIAGTVLEGTKRQSGFIVHEPCSVLAILRLRGEVQFDYIIIGKRIGGHADICTASVSKNARGHIFFGAIDKGAIHGAAEVLCQSTDEIILKVKAGVLDKLLICLNEHSQLMAVNRFLGEVIDSVVDGDIRTLRHPLRQVITGLGKMR